MSHWMGALASSVRQLRLLNTLHVAPVVLFAFAEAPALVPARALLAAFILHALIYPASVGFNAYYDRDTAPTNGLLRPPPVHRALWLIVTLMDAAAMVLATTLSMPFAGFVVVTVAASRLYSHPRTRFKARPIAGFLWVVFFQGGFSFAMVLVALSDDPMSLLSWAAAKRWYLPASFCSALVAGSYPLTQVYQFEEDAARGDITIAMRLGVAGTFRFSSGVLTAAYLFAAAYFWQTQRPWQLAVLSILLSLPFGYLQVWRGRVRRDASFANHQYAHRMNWVSALAGTACFVAVGVLNQFYPASY